jgi:hypothetical protein
MNQGERDELILKIKLIELRDSKEETHLFGRIQSLKMGREFSALPSGLMLSRIHLLSDLELYRIAEKCGISKAGTMSKADVLIDGVPFSLKSTRSAPPALINHTTRPGFEFAAKHGNGNIQELDRIIEEYWRLRIARKIGEDVRNSDPLSPFRNQKGILRPFLNYFIFIGTGSRLSDLPADKILSFSNPIDQNTWSIQDERDAIDLFWDNLIFSMRSKKGMPPGYPDRMSNRTMAFKTSIDKWTRKIDGDYRGALHVRTRS